LKARSGRSIVGGFVALPNAYFRTPEFAALSGRATKLLIAIAMQYNRSNNGDLVITKSLMAARGFHSADQLFKARDELIAAGWIMCTRQGGRNIPSLYALTWEPIDRCDGKLDVQHGPTPPHLWKPENARYREGKTLPRTAEQPVPYGGTAMVRTAEQGMQS
jgi:hypothetical protein